MSMVIIKREQMKLASTSLDYLLSPCAEPANSRGLIVLMHGFPENAWSWEAYFAPLRTHYTVLAPHLPGYASSAGFQKESDYKINNLVAVLAEFLEKALHLHQSGKGKQENKVHLVAHDWGGVVAWPLAAFHSDKIHKLSILNAAHPSTFTREMANNTKQQANSDYISDLISEQAFEITSANEHLMLKRLYGGWYKRLSARQQSEYLKQWDDEVSMRQAFAYYKNMPQLVTKRLKANTDIHLPNIRIDIPTQVLWGLKDTAFVPQVLDGMGEWVADLRLQTFDDADHWLHHQKPADILAALLKFHQS